MATDERNIDYATRYAKDLDQLFSENSLTERYVTKEDSFSEEGGVASVYFRTVDTSDFLAQHTGPTFGAPTAVKSSVVRKDIELFYNINKVLPNVDINDTAGALKEAGKVLAAGIREQYTPLVDKIRIATAIKAATDYGGANKVEIQDELTPEKYMDGIDKMIAALKNVRSYAGTQAMFIPASHEAALDKNLFTVYAPSKNDSIIENGVIGKYKGIEMVVLPDDLFNTMTITGAPYGKATFTPAKDVYALLWDKRIIKATRKLYRTFVLTGREAVTAGADGALLRGLFRPGAWVLDANKHNKAVAVLQKASEAA